MEHDDRPDIRRATRRLVGILALPALFIIVGSMIVLLTGIIGNQEDEAVRYSEGVLTAISTMLNPSAPETSAKLHQLAEREQYQRLWVLDRSGIIVASSIFDEVGEPPGPQWEPWVASASAAVRSEAIRYGGAWLRVATLKNEASNLTTVALIPVRPVAGLVGAIGWGVLLTVVLGVGAVGFVYLIVAARIRSPFVAITEVIRQGRQGQDVPEETVARLSAQSAAISGHLVPEVFSVLTKYQRSKKRFQQTIEQFRQLLDLTPLSISIFAENGQLVEANATFYKNLALPLPAQRSDPSLPVAPYIPLQQILTLGARSKQENCTFSNIEATFVNTRKEPQPVRIHVQAVQTEGRSVFFVVAEDRAEQKQLHSKLSDFNDAFSLRVEEQTHVLRESVQRLETFINEADVLFATFDPAGKTLFWNKAVTRRVGAAAAKMSTRDRFVRALISAGRERITFSDWLRGRVPTIRVFKTAAPERDWILHWTKATDSEGHLIVTGLPVHVPKALPSVSGEMARKDAKPSEELASPLSAVSTRASEAKPPDEATSVEATATEEAVTDDMPELPEVSSDLAGSLLADLEALPSLNLDDSWGNDLLMDEAVLNEELDEALDVDPVAERDSESLTDEEEPTSPDRSAEKTSEQTPTS